MHVAARNEALTGAEIARRAGISASMVRGDLKRLGLPLGQPRGSKATAAAVAASARIRPAATTGGQQDQRPEFLCPEPVVS